MYYTIFHFLVLKSLCYHPVIHQHRQSLSVIHSNLHRMLCGAGIHWLALHAHVFIINNCCMVLDFDVIFGLYTEVSHSQHNSLVE